MPISNTDDTIDSLDVISEIDDLECLLSCKQDDINEHQETIDEKQCEIDDMETELSALTRDEQDERDRLGNNIDALKTDIEEIKGFIELIENDIIDVNEELEPLKEMADYAENYAPDWCDGATLIHEEYFTEYAKELVEECELDMKVPSYVEIDWEATADNMKVDYTSVEYDGATYYIR